MEKTEFLISIKMVEFKIFLNDGINGDDDIFLNFLKNFL